MYSLDLTNNRLIIKCILNSSVAKPLLRLDDTRNTAAFMRNKYTNDFS